MKFLFFVQEFCLFGSGSARLGAISDYDRAIALDPKIAGVYGGRGLARNGLGDSAGAIDDYNQAIALDPQMATAYLYRGLARYAQENLVGAIDDLTNYLELAPNATNRAEVEQLIANLQRAK